MNSISEIGLQNQQDFWSKLYMSLGRSILDICGRGGEGVIRRGLRQMARERGEELRARYRARGIKTNLKTLYQSRCDCSGDPRWKAEILADQEDKRIWEVYTCPLATFWLDQGEGDLGNLYCEENQHGRIEGFTGGKGQLNLTKKLTCHRENGCRADNHCRFSSYYRAANLDEAERTASFSEYGRADAGGELKPPVQDFREHMNKLCIQTICFLAKSAGEEYGEEGLCAVAFGLEDVADWAVDMMRHGAEATLSVCDRDFLYGNIPLALETTEDKLWEQYGGGGISPMVQTHLLTPIKEALLGEMQ